MKKVLGRVANVVEKSAEIGGISSGWLVVLMMLLTVVAVFMRYVARQPLMVAEEFSAYMLVAIAYIGTAYTWRAKGHVRITSLLDRLPNRVSDYLRLLGLVLAFVFLVILSWRSYYYLAYSFDVRMASPSSLRFPLQGPQMALPIGFTIVSLLLIVEICRAVLNIRAGKTVEDGPTG